MSLDNFFIDIACKQQNCKREKLCGDTFLFKRMGGGTRSIVVLSDGMGHGVKANVLSTITATMLSNFDYNKLSVSDISRFVLKSLPVCSIRKVSYSTFSVIDIDLVKSLATITEYDNPKRIIFRGAKRLQTIEELSSVKTQERVQTINSTRFHLREGDRIVLMSDGVTQSGTGREYSFGWGREKVVSFIMSELDKNIDISSSELASKVVWEAIKNDGGVTNDDVSCAVVTIRKAKRMLMCTCSPSTGVDENYLSKVNNFNGTKIIVGHRLATMIAERRAEAIHKRRLSRDPDVEPEWKIEGVDLVTESLVTLNKVLDMLVNSSTYIPHTGAAYKILKALLVNDEINIMMGKQLNKAGVYTIDDYDLRHNIILRMIAVLEKQYNKEVKLTYI